MTNILPVRILLAFGLAASLTCDLGAQAVNRPTKKTTPAVQPELSFKARLLAEANRGDPKAQFNLGLCFIDGADCERSYDQALKWLRQSAEGGNSEAQWFLVQFRGDTGDEKEILGDKYGNRPEALKWLLVLARNNDSGAQDWLGLKYSVGDGVPKDLIVAEHWLRLAAEQGNISSQISLARLLLDTGDDDSQRLERWAAGFKWLTVCHALAASEKIYALSEKDEIKSKARLKNADHFLFVSEHELKDKRKVQVIAQRPEGERQARAWLEIHQRR